MCLPVKPPQVMSSGRSANGREVQIPLQQVAPSLVAPVPITPPSHRSTNPWPPCDLTPQPSESVRSPVVVLVWCWSGFNPPLSLSLCVCSGAPAGFQPLHGGFRDVFVEKPEAKYCCEACRRVLCEPRQTECGHRFCQSCINDILR